MLPAATPSESQMVCYSQGRLSGSLFPDSKLASRFLCGDDSMPTTLPLDPEELAFLIAMTEKPRRRRKKKSTSAKK